jgi:hypothetical protein
VNPEAAQLAFVENDYLAHTKTARSELIVSTYKSRGVSRSMENDPICSADQPLGTLA